VVIAARYELDGSGFESHRIQDTCFVLRPSAPFLGSTHPLVRGVPAVFYGVKAAGASP
jgi:hypothetical protein